jgi:hypothetical protein
MRGRISPVAHHLKSATVRRLDAGLDAGLDTGLDTGRPASRRISRLKFPDPLRRPVSDNPSIHHSDVLI